MNISTFAQKVGGLSGKLITQATVAGSSLLVWAGAQPKTSATIGDRPRFMADRNQSAG
jgi:hypothetical protein